MSHSLGPDTASGLGTLWERDKVPIIGRKRVWLLHVFGRIPGLVLISQDALVLPWKEVEDLADGVTEAEELAVGRRGHTVDHGYLGFEHELEAS